MKGRGKSAKNKLLIAAATDILARIEPASVRAVCYQLFIAKLIPDMSKRSTDRVSIQLRDAREADLIPWEWIVDETREAERVSAWKDPAAYCETVKRAYRRDRWATQPTVLEVWSEKGTVRGLLKPVLDAFGVTFRVMHGFGSATTVYQVAQESAAEARPTVALYVGDWDPSGLYMSDVDLPQRLARYGGDVEIRRVALRREHLAGLPSFPASDKRGDTRYRWFRTHHGDQCWELDALDPVVLRQAVESAIVDYIDPMLWTQAEDAERAELESISSVLSTWPTNSRQAQNCPGGQR